MMHRFTGESSQNVTRRSLNVKQETFDNLSTVSCLGEEPPSLLSDDEFDVGPLTIVKSEIAAVHGKKQQIERSTADGHPAKSTMNRWNEAQYAKSTELKYGCPRCPKTFDNRIDRMLHKQIHSFEAIPRITDISGFICIDLNAAKSVACSDLQISHKITAERREGPNIYGQGDKSDRTYVQENIAAAEAGSEMEEDSLIMHDATFDNIEGYDDNRCSVWDADLVSENSSCDGSSDENYSDNDLNSSNESTESISNVGNAGDASNAKSHNASAKQQRKSSPNAKEARPNEATAIKKKSNAVRKHCLVHKGDMKFSCSYCDRRFKQSGNLKRHLKVHTDERPHKCDICGKGFIHKADCLAHKITHTGKRPYKCTDCEKSFIRKGHYVKHCKLHTGEKPLSCQFCGKKFSRAESMKYHLSLHKGPKPYSCLMCKKNMSSADKWKRHIEKNHKNEYEDVAEGKGEKKKPRKKAHECTTCGKYFVSPCHLLRHERVHTGERPFACEFCDRRFIQSTQLKVHLLTHSGTKPYLCIICKIPFSTKDEMVSHRQMTHEKALKEKESATLDSVDTEPPSSKTTDNETRDMNNIDRTFEGTEAANGVQFSSANKGPDVGQKSVEKKKKRRHFPSENESELNISISHALPKKSGKRGSDLSDYVLTETQDVPSLIFDDVCEPPSVPQECDIPYPPNKNITDHLTVDRHGERIRFKRSSIEYIVQKNAKKHPKNFYLVWSENFSADLAAAVALNGSNCLLCVKKFDASALPDVWSLSPNFSLQTANVNFGSVSEPVHFFNFGDMNLPLSRRSFKAYKKIESRIKKTVRPEGMELKNIIKFSKKDSSWYNVLMQQLKGDCIVTNRVL